MLFCEKKNGVTHELITSMRANQITRITSDFKMDVIQVLN